MITLESETVHVNPKFPIHKEWINNGIITSGETIDNLLRNIKSSFLNEEDKGKLLTIINSDKKRILEELRKEGDTTIYNPDEDEFAYFLRYEE